MTVKDLKELLAGMPDEMQVLCPLDAGDGFTGHFFSPCIEESGEAEFGLDDLDDEDVMEQELLGKPPRTEKSFALVPCGFFQQHEDPPAELN